MAETERTLIILDPTLKKGFTAIPNAVIRARGLSLAAKGMYATLLSYAWQDDACFPGQERLAEDADCDVRSIRRYLVELRDYGLISWQQRGLNRPNIYFIHDLQTVPALNAYGLKDRTNLSGPDRTEMYFLDRTKMSYYKDSDYNTVVVDTSPTPPTTTTQAHEPATDLAAQPGPAQLADKPVNQPGDAPAGTEKPDRQPGLERKNREAADATVTEIQVAIRAATDADVPLEDIYAILAAYSQEEIFEKIQLMGNMGRQELRNVPGLLVYLLQENSRHIPGRARGRAASKGRSARSAGEGQPGRKRKRQAEPNPHDYLDPEQAAKLEALRDEENRRALQKELQEREEREKRKQFLISLYAQ